MPEGVDPVGAVEIAERLGVPPGTVRSWHHHRTLPPPAWRLHTAPFWNWPQIVAWAIETGRLPADHPAPPAPPKRLPEIVGLAEIAERFGVSHRSVYDWARGGRLPPHRWVRARTRLWLLSDLDFARKQRSLC
ncbi:helix-turn-helix transcriptional regulator [Aciditerrimonas ferrireducens]|uniref:Helix-turn-helix transcriptional regulator n=1 Tax=Aciditerrimonas ferrireducens TaxID=667306 RepID=A0ABV6BZU1_9ACTN